MDPFGECETTEVVICGCGPTGAMLSGYLGRMSISNVVLEKESGITTDPRGIALDEDGIRLIQGLGIYDQVHQDIGSCMQIFKFIGGTQKDLSRDAFLEMDYATTEGGTGHVGFISHKQPVLEKHLRCAMASSDFCQLRSGCSVVEIQQDDQWTYCRYRDEAGEIRSIRSRFLVGADGKTGFTRKNYLEPLGIQMLQAHDAFYDVTWVALNWEITLPAMDTHPDFPLWKLGYSPEQVYDLFFPKNFRFLCNPERPAICTRFGLPSDRLWRFEFVVLDDEDGDLMASPEKTRAVIFPYLTHSGKRYGLLHDVQYPEDCIRVLRSRPFRFSARSCNKWSLGRVALCGDAAHVFPPFGGQGISSGFRDAVSLAWRLALLCRQGTLDPPRHEIVLKSWYLERKQQLERSLAVTIRNGEFVTEGNPLKIFLRSCYLFIMNLVPSWRRELRLGHRKGMIRYQFAAGMPFIPDLNGGLCLPQVYCKSRTGEVFFTDDVIFHPSKRGLFQLLIYLENPSELESARESVSSIEGFAKGEIHLDEATYVINETEQSFDSSNLHGADSVYQLASAEEFAKSPLCEGRPEPQYYDMHYLGKTLGGSKFVIVRPDRFIYAACSNGEELKQAIIEAVNYLLHAVTARNSRERL
ncbi:putative monooxygenase [Aspergillus mulundensis]|uniref:FAD-binding domain-containing protein n=1 Tax=Aspergillus mulundensis TaxID=1810919 RepID=A0A3D8T840_9EURO|nr:Uncharacterized protein DSM5745_01480 [Aspergillus mulundensis]RDW94158.1 Uncharacterized protein DSM5745_01480 [Aspergillus mulundensis]